MNIQPTSYQTVTMLVKRQAETLAKAVYEYSIAEHCNQAISEILGLKSLTSGQKSRIKNLWQLDDFIRYQARFGAQRHRAGISLTNIQKTLTGHQNKFIKNDGQNPLPILSTKLIEFLSSNIQADDPFRPNPEEDRGNGKRPHHEEHMIFGSYVSQKVPTMIIDGTLTEEQANVPGNGVKFALTSFAIALMLRTENDLLDTKGEDGIRLKSSFPPGKEGILTARCEHRNINLCMLDEKVLRKHGWTPLLCDPVAGNQPIILRILRSENLEKVILA